MKEFKAGRIKHHEKYWRSITHDPFILRLVEGTHIELNSMPQTSKCPKRPYHFNKEIREKITLEIENMLVREIIEIAHDTEEVFMSNIFAKEKTDGALRVILDLTSLNEHVMYKHFKMDSIQSAMDLMSPSCYMASIDWKDAYYSVPIANEFRKYLAFIWEDKMYQFTCLPNGLSSGPRYFTRLSKVLFSELRKQGFMSTSYIDDSLLIADTLSEAKQNIRKTVEISGKAGFVVHPEKSVLTPTHEITYLGFILNSKNMTIRVTTERAQKIKINCLKVLNLKKLSVRKLAKVIGLMVASFQGVKYGQLHYRMCDNHKNTALKEGKGDFRTSTTLSSGCKKDLKWWVDNIDNASNPITKPNPDIIMETDASGIGWGACIQGDHGRKTGGKWSKEEATQHINYLELLAVWLALQSFFPKNTNTSIKVLSDNTTTVAYLNHMGGTKPKCNKLAHKIWSWCEENNNWILAAHIPGKTNVIADKQSRTIKDNMEWKLCPQKFREICTVLGTPEIDLFATRLNHQLPRYMSWKPDPGTEAVDAFTEPWGGLFPYIFPPFNLIGKVLGKIEREKVKAILVVPKWETQPWFPKFLKLCTDPPYVLSSRYGPLLSHPRRDKKELPKSKLLVGLTYARASKMRVSLQQHGKSSWHRGKTPQRNSTDHTSKSGITCVWKETLIQLPQI